MKFDYYYGMETEQFPFFRIPQCLFLDKRFAGLSVNAKVLYGLLLDRMSLSMKNGWVDGENRTYIYYSMDQVMEKLGCAKSTCVRIMAELDDKKGIGLIQRVRRGQGKPDRIYVKNFASLEEMPDDVQELEERGEQEGSGDRQGRVTAQASNHSRWGDMRDAQCEEVQGGIGPMVSDILDRHEQGETDAQDVQSPREAIVQGEWTRGADQTSKTIHPMEDYGMRVTDCSSWEWKDHYGGSGDFITAPDGGAQVMAENSLIGGNRTGYSEMSGIAPGISCFPNCFSEDGDVVREAIPVNVFYSETGGDLLAGDGGRSGTYMHSGNVYDDAWMNGDCVREVLGKSGDASGTYGDCGRKDSELCRRRERYGGSESYGDCCREELELRGRRERYGGSESHGDRCRESLQLRGRRECYGSSESYGDCSREDLEMRGLEEHFGALETYKNCRCEDSKKYVWSGNCHYETSRNSIMGTLAVDGGQIASKIPVFSEEIRLNEQNDVPQISEMEILEVAKREWNNTEYNQTEYIQTDWNPIDPIHLSDQENGGGWSDGTGNRSSPHDIQDNRGRDGLDGGFSPDAYLRMIRKNIEYDHFLQYLPSDELVILQELYQILMDIVYAKGGVFRINGAEYPPEYVRSKAFQLNSYHIQYILECMKDRNDVRNLRAYMLATMFNAITTMDHSYQQQIRRESFGAWG